MLSARKNAADSQQAGGGAGDSGGWWRLSAWERKRGFEVECRPGLARGLTHVRTVSTHALVNLWLSDLRQPFPQWALISLPVHGAEAEPDAGWAVACS